MGHRWGAPEDDPIEVDEEPLDCRGKGPDEAGLHMVWAWGLAVGLVQRGVQASHGVLPEMGPRTLRDLGHVATEDSFEAGYVHRVLAVKLLPEGAQRGHHVVGFDQVKPVGTPVAILGLLGVCIYVPAGHHWLISYPPVHLT